MKIKRTIVIDDLTPIELADAWWSLDGDQQARFFNAIGTAPADQLHMQLNYITDSSELAEHGRETMLLLGEYASTEE